MKRTDFQRALAAKSLVAAGVLFFAASPALAEQRRDEKGGGAVINKRERTAKVDPGGEGFDRVRVAPVEPSGKGIETTALALAIGPGKKDGPKFDGRRARVAPVDPDDNGITSLALTLAPGKEDGDSDHCPGSELPGPLFTAEFLRLYLAWLGIDLQTALCSGLLSDPRLYAMFLDWLHGAGRIVPTAEPDAGAEPVAVALALEGAKFEKILKGETKEANRGGRGRR